MSADKRSVTVAGHRTSISLESEFWAALGDIARAEGRSINDLVTEIDQRRAPDRTLSSALRIHVLESFRTARESDA